MCDGVGYTHHVVVHAHRAHRRHFQHLQRACGGNDGVGGRNGRDYVFHDALGEAERHPSDAEPVSAGQRRVVDPLHVLQIVWVEHLALSLGAPRNEVGVLDAVRGGPRRFS